MFIMKLRKAAVAVLVVSAAGVATLLVWLLWTMFAPLDYLFDAPAVWPVVNRDVHPGEEVFVDLKFCKATDLPAEIGRMTVGKDRNGSEYVYNNPNITGSIPAGCHHKRLSVATIPDTAPPGRYQITITIRYQYSALRTYQQNFVTEKFDVTPKAR